MTVDERAEVADLGWERANNCRTIRVPGNWARRSALAAFADLCTQVTYRLMNLCDKVLQSTLTEARTQEQFLLSS